jgi:pyrroline-5-carboxylate reductase
MSGRAGTLLLVGCGRMGGALLAGWLERGTAASVHVVEPEAGGRAFAGRPGVAIHGSADALPADLVPEVVVFAVKPQVMAEIVPAYRRFVGPRTVFLSIAAGKTIRFFAGLLGGEAALVRAMPNTPAAVGRGITVCCAGPGTTAAQRELCGSLLEAVGEVAWVEDEALIDPVTAVSGSGPAYVFHLVEALAASGERAGLPAELAMRLARATVSGSGELLRQSADPAAKLRENVTSPNGTTHAALQVLMAKDGLTPLMEKAVAAATRRSRELAD